MSNDTFHFSISVKKTRVSADKFSNVPLFHHFFPKIDSRACFDSVFSNIVWFNRKTKNTVRFSIIKIRISVIFKHLHLKQTSEICQKIGSLDEKTEQNRLKVTTLSLYFQKNFAFIEKQKTLIDFLL